MTLTQLHPGAKWLFRFRAYIGFIFLGIFGGWTIIPLMAIILAAMGSSPTATIVVGLILFLVSIILIVVIGEIYARMSYARWFYEFTDDGLKLERGIIWKRYSNVPYERIQNVDVHRGILARMFGFSSVNIQTAGFSAQAGAEGHIPAVDVEIAEQIRGLVMKKITKRGM